MSKQLIKGKRYISEEISSFYDGYDNLETCFIVEDADDKRERGVLIPQFDNSGEPFLVYMNGRIYPASAFEGMELIIIEEISLKPN